MLFFFFLFYWGCFSGVCSFSMCFCGCVRDIRVLWEHIFLCLLRCFCYSYFLLVFLCFSAGSRSAFYRFLVLVFMYFRCFHVLVFMFCLIFRYYNNSLFCSRAVFRSDIKVDVLVFWLPGAPILTTPTPAHVKGQDGARPNLPFRMGKNAPSPMENNKIQDAAGRFPFRMGVVS